VTPSIVSRDIAAVAASLFGCTFTKFYLWFWRKTLTENAHWLFVVRARERVPDEVHCILTASEATPANHDTTTCVLAGCSRRANTHTHERTSAWAPSRIQRRDTAVTCCHCTNARGGSGKQPLVIQQYQPSPHACVVLAIIVHHPINIQVTKTMLLVGQRRSNTTKMGSSSKVTVGRDWHKVVVTLMLHVVAVAAVLALCTSVVTAKLAGRPHVVPT
jgi:hypothetical protein